MDYLKAKALFESARNPAAGKPIANNTRVVQRGESYAVRLHETDILTFSPNGDVIYNTGGWRTVTAKARMNEYGPAYIFSERGTWYIGMRGCDDTVPYAEGCRINSDGRICGAANAADVEAEETLRKNIRKYAAKYIAALYRGEIEAPSGGDCWLCMLRTPDGKRATSGAGHILSHIDEDYFVPSLIWNALGDRYGGAYKHDVAILQKHANVPPDARLFAPDGGFVRKTLQTAVRKHCLRECGLAY